jgi:phosphate-selective porin OprO/OprP
MKLLVLFGVAVASPVLAQPTVAGDETKPSDPEPVAQPGEPPAPATPQTAALDDHRPPPPPPVFDAAAVERIVDERIARQPPTAGWSDGFFIQTRDGRTRLKIGGYTQFDGRFFVPEASDPKVDQFGFRSIRPELVGTVLDHYDFRLLPDFAGGKLVIQDAHLDIRYSDAFKVRFGKYKAPFGLERLQTEPATTFVERGLPSSLTPNRDLGVQLFGDLAHGIVAYQVGVFNGVPDGGSSDGDTSNGKEVAARVFVRPFAQSETAAKEFGVGGAVTYGRRTGTLADPQVAIYKTQAQTTFFQYKTGTTLMDTVISDGIQWRATAQADWYAGPVGVLAEYVRSVQHVALDGTHDRIAVDSWQVLAQWVLTGDDATYKSVTPRHPFDPAKGYWGAVDVAARIGELRLIDGSAFDDKIADPTKSARRAWSTGAGLDWFPNRTFRFVIDLERTWFRLGAATGDRPPETSIIGRAQTVF